MGRLRRAQKHQQRMVKTETNHGPKARRPRGKRPEAARQHRRNAGNVARNPRSTGRSGLPTKQAVLDFIKSASEDKSQAAQLGKREIARAFAVKGGDRVALKQLLAEMTEEGLLEGNRRGFKEPGALPPVTVLEIVARDAEGELVAEAAGGERDAEGRRERVLVLPWRGSRKA